MNKMDTFDINDVVYNFDKPRVLKFTMQKIFELEMIYGSMRAAFDSFYDKDAGKQLLATEIFLQILLGLSIDEIREIMDAHNLTEARGKIPLALETSFSKTEENKEKNNTPYEPNDWDWIYYAARYRLLMSDDEFWGCTPKRFEKLHYLWCVDKGLIEKEPEIFYGEVSY